MGRKKKGEYLLFFLVPVLLLGCAAMDPDSHERILMQHPGTMDMKECQIDGPWRNNEAFAAVEECAKRYEQQGYVRWGQY